MQIDVSITPDLFAALQSEAKRRGLTVSRVAMEAMAGHFGISPGTARRIAGVSKVPEGVAWG